MALRALHRGLGLGAAIIGLALAISGVLLSLEPISEALRTGSLMQSPDISVATLVDAAVLQIEGVERIEKSANNTVWVHFNDADSFGKVAFDPATLSPIPTPTTSSFWSAIKDFHRSLFLGEFGRAITGVTAFSLFALTLTGVMILMRRMGGWRGLIAPPKAGTIQSLHLDFGRIAAAGLLVASVTGVILSLATFEILPSSRSEFPVLPTIDTTQNQLAVRDLIALQNTPLASFRELVMPFENDPTDAYMLTTHTGTGFINPMSGSLVGFTPHTARVKFFELIYLLHTGQGAWWLSLLLGLLMLAVPVVIFSGAYMTLSKPKIGKNRVKNTPAQAADAIILVGSEGMTTWGFAHELSQKLTLSGKRVHLCDLNNVATHYKAAKHLFILTSTYGQGAAPVNATNFIEKLKRLQQDNLPYTVLGFGDKSFPHFCKFAQDIDTACAKRGLHKFATLTRIDRQSSQSFNGWGRMIGEKIGAPLNLEHTPTPPKSTTIKLHSRVDYGQDVQSPVSILKFTATFGKLPPHQVGDLLGVYAPGSNVPRFYSLASTHMDGVIEICVRKQNGGVCSGFLTSMAQGAVVDVFIKSNPKFRPSKAKYPLILIGAGAGIGPLVGFSRANHPNRTVHFYWGGRDPKSDFLYQDELAALKASGKIAHIHTAFSRVVDGGYVQEKMHASAQDLRFAVQQGAQILVCGGAHMARDVQSAWNDILAPIGLSVAQLQTQKRYLEDVY